MSIRIVDLRAEQLTRPIGIEVAQPRLSWRIESDRRGTRQTAYRVRAAFDPAALDRGELVWDSGVVEGGRTLDVVYAGPPVAPMQRLWWTVDVTDERGEVGRAEPTWFEAGLGGDGWLGAWTEAEDAEAAADRAAGLQWMWSAEPLDGRPHGFRLDFMAPDDVERAEILLSGKDHLRGVWVNGVPATLDRPFGFETALPFWGTLTAFDGTVTAGTNSVCALVEAETTGFFPVDGGAFAALIRLHRRDGSVERIVSGPAWRVCPAPADGWTEPGADTSAWAAAQPSGANVANDPRPAEPAMLLRTCFTPRAPVSAARLYATALGAYDATINGVPVSATILAPEMSVARDHVFYQSHDVTALIAEGENVLGAMVGDGWYASASGWRIERYGFGPAPRRFRAQLRLDYADGSHEWVATDGDWRIARSAILQSEIYDGEMLDARLEQPGWEAPGFDASGWDVARLGEAPTCRLIAQPSPAIERMGRMRAVAVTEPSPGVHVFDFGQNFAGWAVIRAHGAAGTTITARFAELLDGDGRADMANLRLARATDRVTLAGTGAAETFEPRFTYHGFRYVEVEGYPGTPGVEDVEGVVVHSACGTTGSIRFADAPLLQRIFDNAMWSQRSNFFSVPTDCPQRDERMGWMGDIQVFLDAAAFNMDVAPFIRRFLIEARSAQRDDGAYPIVVPQPLSFPDVTTAGWSEAGIILPWQLWQRYGDTAVIDENWAAMEAWMDHVAARNPDHVWRHERGLDLGDWLSVDAVKPDDETTPRVLCATAYWAWSAALMAEMAHVTGRDEAAARYAGLRHAIDNAYAAELVDADGRCGNGSQTSQVLSLWMGLVPEDRRAAAAKLLADDIRARGDTLSTGFLGTPYLLDVLADAGRWDVVADLLLQTRYPSWGYMPSVGATTVWERWNGDTGDLSMNSYNHYAFGAVVGFFYRRLAGIAPASPGFERMRIAPHWLPQIGRVEADYDSVVGRIATAIDGDADGLSLLALTVPANTIAEVVLPLRDWREGGTAIDAHPDVSDVERAGDVVRFTVGGGTYRFTIA
ncbi:alpha-L-rhamnosidase [Sphingomonas jinjuensis]|uniref:alpha-L-rhamnosidase n=1 Tax=Sphingomonas jinjuensis TaxID=535907 RepID=A0A840F7E0_9SPHN|nr:alpha-L-rhamnosidase [Sphingomonas jinjuensis]MBB4152236.1 alpha-L-rhamnosidase [Sphingomonas jinjuensis]